MNKVNIEIQIDYAPEQYKNLAPEGSTPVLDNKVSEEFIKWCEKHGFTALNSSRGAWCSRFSTYLRGAVGIATTICGEQFLVYKEDLK